MNNIQTIRYRPRIVFLNNVFAYSAATVMIYFWRLIGSSQDTPQTPLLPARTPKEFVLKSEKERAIDGLVKRAAIEWADDNIILAEMIFVEAVKIRDMTEAEFNRL